MRKLGYTLILVTFIALFFGNAKAEIVPIEKARKVALNFYSYQASIYFKELTTIPEIQDEKIVYDGDTPILYQFNMINPKGYTIVAAEDRVIPVLAFSFNSQISESKIAPAFQWIINSLKNEIIYTRKNELRSTDEIEGQWIQCLTNQFESKSVNVLFPLTDDILWDQGKFFNALCPLDNAAGESLDYRVPTGCVATAMAIIMKYNSWPLTGTGSASYNHSVYSGYSNNYGTLSANFGAATYNWSAMPGIVNSSNSEVAKIMYHCGVAVNMDYSPDGSGAYVGLPSYYPQGTAEKAFKNYFKYPNVTFASKSNYSDDTWKTKIINELNENRPILYSGDDGSAGHAFVLDGYMESLNNYFHFNFGWGGSGNGNFLLTSINPGSGGIGGGGYNFSQNQEGLFGLYNPSVGIESHTGYTTFSVYPNPANEKIVIDLSAFTSNITISIIDLTGKKVASQSITNNGNYNLDIRNLNKGIYQIHVSDKNISGSQKLVIVR